MPNNQPLSPQRFRADTIAEALRQSQADGSTLVFSGETNDYLATDTTLTRLPWTIAAWGATRSLPTLTYSPAEGTKRIVAPNGPANTAIRESAADRDNGPVADVVRLLKNIVGSKQPTILLLDFAEAMLPSQSDSAGRSLAESILLEEVVSQALDPRLGWSAGGNLLILISRTGNLPTSLVETPGIRHFAVALPSVDERLAAIIQMRNSTRHQLVLETGLTPPDAARLTGGMSLDSLSRLRMTSDESHPLTKRTIISEKAATIRKMAGSTLTVFDEDRTLDDVAGLPQVRLYLEDMQRIGRSTIRLILAGSPGNGKTLSALAIAHQLGVPAVALNQIKDMWVGNSEKALGRALDVIKSMAPVLVIADEFDQTIGGSRASSSALESSSVDSSLRGMFMEFTGDNAVDNGISVVGMSNNPQGIDAAFLSRFETIAVLEPSSPQEKTDVVEKNTAKVKATVDKPGLIRAFTEDDKTFSCRDLVDLLVAGQVYAALSGTQTVGYEQMSQAIHDSQHYSTAVEESQSLSAIAYTHSARYLPWNAAPAGGGSQTKPPAYARQFVRPDGTVDIEQLSARLEGRPYAH